MFNASLKLAEARPGPAAPRGAATPTPPLRAWCGASRLSRALSRPRRTLVVTRGAVSVRSDLLAELTLPMSAEFWRTSR